MKNKLMINPPAKKFLKKIKEKPLKSKFREAVTEIQRDPFNAGEAKKGDLSGIFGYDIYYKGTNYEIAYMIQKDEKGYLIVIILSRKRENFYEHLKRYMKT